MLKIAKETGSGLEKVGARVRMKEYYENLEFSHGMMINVSYETAPEVFLLHWHVFAEILVGFEGGFDMTLGHNAVSFEKNDIAICLPGDLHSIQCRGSEGFLVLQFPFELITSLRDFNSIIYLLTQSRAVRFDPANAASVRMRDILCEIKDIHMGDDAFKDVLLYSRLLLFFVELGRELKAAPERADSQPGGKSAELITEACIYIAQNCHEPLDLETVSKHVGFSKYHFAHLFRKYVNMTFLEFLTSQRIKKAEQLLGSLEVSITEIALRTGYTSFSTFNRLFKKAKGCSPSEFRNKIRQLD